MLKRAFLVVSLSVVASQILPVVLLSGDFSREKNVAYGADSTDPQTVIVNRYKNSLKVIGKYVTSKPLSERASTSDQVTVSLPADDSKYSNLDFSLSKIEYSTLPSYDENGNQKSDDYNYVTNVFYYFDSTSVGSDMTLVLNYAGAGAVFPTDFTDVTDISQAIYGDPGKCVSVGDESDPDSATFSPSTCEVSIAAITDKTERESTWYNFADRVIPEELQPTSCNISASQEKTRNILVDAVVGRAEAISLSEVGDAIWGMAGAAVDTCNQALTQAVDFFDKTVPGKIWGFVSPATPLIVKAMRWTAATGTNAARAFLPGVAQVTKKAAGGLDVEQIVKDFTSSCTWQTISGFFSGGMNVLGAFGSLIKCVVGKAIESIQNSIIDQILRPLLEYSILPITSQVETARNFFIGTAHAGGFEQQLKNPDNNIVKIWRVLRSIVDIAVILALLVIAFANIFHINLNTYGAKKAIPGLVIGVIAANASLLIISFLADVCQQLSLWAPELVYGGGNNSITWLILDYFGHLTKAFGILSAIPVIGLILMIYYIFLVLAFCWIFFKRAVIISILSMVSPLAFVCYGIPPFQKYFFQWWDNFLRYLFMFPVVLLSMAILVLIGQNLSSTNLLTTSGIVGIATLYIFGTFILKIPKLMSKDTMDVGATFKKMLGYLPNVAASAAGAHKFVSGQKANNLQKRIKAAQDDKNAPVGEVARLRLERIRTLQRAKKTGDILNKGLGFSTILGRPEDTAKKWWEARDNATKKEANLAAVTATIGGKNISDMVSGRAGGYDDKKTLAKKLLTEAGDSTTAYEYLTGPSKKAVNNIIKHAETLSPEEQGKLLRQISDAKVDKMKKILAELKDKGVDLGDLGLFQEGEIASWFGIASRESKRKNSAPIPDMGKIKDYADLPFGKAAGQATAPNTTSTAGPIDRGYLSPILTAKQNEAASMAESIRTPEELTGLGQSIDSLKDSLIGLQSRWQTPELEKDKTELRASTLEAIKSLTGKDIDPGVEDSKLASITENLAAAVASGVHSGNMSSEALSSMAEKLESSHEAAIRSEEIASNISPESIAELSKALSQATTINSEELFGKLESALGGHLDKLTDSLGRQLSADEKKQSMLNLASQLQQVISGPGNQKSLASVITRAWSKELGVHTSSTVTNIPRTIAVPTPLSQSTPSPSPSINPEDYNGGI